MGMYHSSFDKALRKRLRIIACEDIGLAEPMLPANLHALYSGYFEVKKATKESGQPSEHMFLAQAVLMLVRAKKSRVLCHASISYFRCHEQAPKRPVPDWAHDRHTKAKSRGLKRFFVTEVQLAINPIYLANP